jgi:hypothetical protein
MALDARQSKDSLTTKHFQYCQIIPLLEQAQLATH